MIIRDKGIETVFSIPKVLLKNGQPLTDNKFGGVARPNSRPRCVMVKKC